MPKLSRRRIARELVRLMTEQPGRAAELIRQTAAYLVQTRQASAAHLLISDIADELFERRGELSADVQTAFKLQDTSRAQIVAMLKHRTGAANVTLSESINPSLLGGVVISTPGLHLDASVKRQLKQLAGGIA